ncbi:transient receptor potential cation channel subfamily A member 1b [Betta splendens]|uniref:Transient receptor potential cation channel subfamily A member 1b n=1 Tax=Betta splendens TaxID=158456 RepID=A0A9W2XRS5_BETSP|nr:transient receptor potential cation channel subfamily A member 1b [Betta splendens]
MSRASRSSSHQQHHRHTVRARSSWTQQNGFNLHPLGCPSGRRIPAASSERDAMNFSREVARQTSCYTYVIEDDEPGLGSLNVFELTEKGDLTLLENLVRRSPEVLQEKDECGAGPLHHAAAGGYVTLIQFITTLADSQELNSCDEQGNVPLHWAVERNKPESCRALLDLGADPNILNAALLSPLHLAINLGHNSLVELLLSYSATDCNLEGDLGNSPVILACSINNCEALSMLIKHGARLCQQNKLGHFAIHAAAFAGAKKAMEVILKAGEELGRSAECHINYLDKSKSSPLHLAVRGGNIDVIRFCIANGAKVDQQQNDRCTPLHLACTQGATEVVKLMLSSVDRVDDIINLTDGACQTPLHRATIFDHAELADYLISLGAALNHIDCKGHSPLLLATSCGAWRTVALLLSKGANVNVKDRCGCNFLHLAILQPKGLKNLPEEVLQKTCVKTLLSCEDSEGCTPLHYACRLGIHDSVKNMLGLSGQVGLACKSKDKKSALHFAAQYGRINTCHRLLESITDSRLLNEGDERGLTPLHLASRGGHTKVVQLLLRKGALFHSDYKGLTCLHHAAAEGYTQTVEILLSANPKLLDKTDEDGNTALHFAARGGHVAAVRLMLNRGAELVLNKNDISFLHEALQNGRKDVVNAVIDNERSTEALKLFSPDSSQRCPIFDMIEFQPETYKYLLDRCVRESDDDHNSPDYHIEYDFRWLQAPLEVTFEEKGKYQPLAALNAMVQYNRIELLNHPVCKKYLRMKWIAYGSRAHLLNMFLYLLGLLPLTHLMVTLRPTMNTTDTGEHQIIMVPTSFIEQSLFLSFCMVMVLVMNIYCIGKEVVQISQQRWNYFKDFSNQCDWMSAIFSLLYIIPLMSNAEGSLHWQAGAVAVLNSWIGFLLYLQRFEGIGIYVVMFGEIMKTLVRIVMLFTYLMLAFGLAFHALMLNQKQFESVPLSVMQTFAMMVGELNYQNNFLETYLDNKLPFGFLTYWVFVAFVLLMPILLVNLLIGLAVGDIAEVQRNAALKRIAMQIDLHTALEDKLPYWFMKRVDKPSVTIYPNRKCSRHYLKQLITGEEETSEVWSRLQAKSQNCSMIENELRKQKSRMKEMSSLLEKQHSLLKLIIQKMEISSEADECDGPATAKGSMWPSMSQVKARGHAVSRWVPLMKAIESKRK